MYWQQAEAVQYPAEPGPRDHPTHTPATCRTIPDAFTPQVDMCRQAVAAAAAAFGKPGGLSGQTRASPFEQPRGGGGLPRQHVPVAPSPFDSQLVQNSLRAEPELMRSFSATLGDGSTYVPPSGSTFQCVRGRSALRASESLDSEGVIPSLDELAAMEDLPDDLQQARAPPPPHPHQPSPPQPSPPLHPPPILTTHPQHSPSSSPSPSPSP